MEWPSGEMPAAVMAAPNVVRQDVRPIPAERPGHVLVKTAYVGLCGTDIELLTGGNYAIVAGKAQYPLVFGHEWSGTVSAVGPHVSGLAPGDRVTGQTIISCGTCRMCRRGRRNICERRAELGIFGYDGAAAQYLLVPATAIIKLPDTLSLRDAALVEPTVTVVHGLERVRCTEGDRVAVIGTGTIGLLAVQLAQVLGATVDAIGIEEEGLALARALGAERAIRPEEAERDAYSVVVEAAGVPHAVGSVTQLLEPGGRAALLGVTNEPAEGFVPSAAVIKDVEIHGILHGLNHYDHTVHLFASGKLDPGVLIDRVMPATDAADAFDLLQTGGRARPKLLLAFTGEEGA